MTTTKRVLVSWVATTHDFFKTNNKGEKVRVDTLINENGPHFNLYKDFADFDTHYLLSQKETESTTIETLASELRKNFKKQVIVKYMNIFDITSVGEIKGKVDDLLIPLIEYNTLEVFISPGTPAMQTVWYLIGSEQSDNKNLKLFKRREKKPTHRDIQENEYLQFNSSNYARTTNIREQRLDELKHSSKSPFITPYLEEVYTKAYQVAGNNRTTVLIQGETGTGKEYLARYIHDNSNRKDKNYVAINCGAYRGDLLESRLFGYKEGAFTGANKTTKGAFEDANGGTIFLDEIGDTTPRMQLTLLRVLQEKVISRIGSTKEIEVDVRVIVASNKNLWGLIKESSFREDLFYRLAIAELELPSFNKFPKKERKIWINYFLENLYTSLDKRLLKLEKEVEFFLLDYPFKGNFRELHNLIELFYTFCEDKVTMKDIPKRILNSKKTEQSLALDSIIREHITKVIEFCDGNISESARLLQVSINTVKSRMKTKN